MYGEIFTGHLSKYLKCFRRRTVCEKNEGQNAGACCIGRSFATKLCGKTPLFNVRRGFQRILQQERFCPDIPAEFPDIKTARF